MEACPHLLKTKQEKDKADGNENGTDFLGIYQECVDILYKEIDYILEGQNADRFRRDFQDVSYVQVPKVYWKETSEKVITLQYCPGIKVLRYNLFSLLACKTLFLLMPFTTLLTHPLPLFVAQDTYRLQTS